MLRAGSVCIEVWGQDTRGWTHTHNTTQIYVQSTVVRLQVKTLFLSAGISYVHRGKDQGRLVIKYSTWGIVGKHQLHKHVL